MANEKNSFAADMISGLFETAGKTRKEFLDRLVNEVMKQIPLKFDLSRTIEELMDRNEIDIQVSVKLRPKGKGLKKKT